MRLHMCEDAYCSSCVKLTICLVSMIRLGLWDMCVCVCVRIRARAESGSATPLPPRALLVLLHGLRVAPERARLQQTKDQSAARGGERW